MAAVGGVSCTYVKGQRIDLRERVEIWQIAGLNGFGAMTLGTGDSAFRFAAIQIDTLANVLTWAASIEALQGTIVTITDDWGTAHNYCLITNVSAVSKTPRVGTEDCRGEIDIRGVKTQ